MKPREIEAIQKAGWSSLEAAVYSFLVNARGIFRSGMTRYTIAASIARAVGTHIDPVAVDAALRELQTRGLASVHDEGVWRKA